MKKIKEYIALPSLILLALTVVSAVINIVCVNSSDFADGFNLSVAAFFRRLFAMITDFIPFSLAEILIILSPVIIVLLVIRAVKLIKAERKKRIRFISALLAFISVFYSLFVMTFSAAYRCSPLEKKLGIERKEVSADELAYALGIIISELDGLEEKVSFSEDGSSEMPFSFSELGEKLSDVYVSLSEKYPFIQKMRSSPKGIILSEPMTYTHIAGVYAFFTGEANVNVNYPDFIRPYTTAHEMAHQRGTAREDEANFIAFLICTESEDDYIKYSGYLNMYEELASALYKADRELYKTVIGSVPENILKELYAYSRFFDKYRDSAASKVSDKINNGYLISQGQTEGTKSYGLVVDLCVAYYRNQINA